MIHPVADQGFGSDPERYERGRPGYPREAVDAILRFASIDETDRILDLAAGTGKLTRLLDRRVVAVEPVPAMRRHLATVVPGVPVVGGVAESLPFADATFGLVTVAQAFHWFDAEAAWPELARVLGPGGTVALIWNARDRSVDWVDRVYRVMDRVEKNAPWRDHDQAQRFDTRGMFTPPVELTFQHQVPMTQERLIDRVTSVSHVAVLSHEDRKDLVEEIRRITAALHGDFAMPYRTDLFLFRRA